MTETVQPIKFEPAVRHNVPLLISLAGGTGSGKSFSALRIAKGLSGSKRFAVIDTENGRALHYADQFEFDHGSLSAPFRPEAYAAAIKTADDAGYPVIVVDSMSHEWDGDGGLLDWQTEEFERMGGRDAVKLSSWIKPKMAHRKLVTQLLQVHAHLVICFRAAERIDMVKNQQGKWEIVPKQSLTGLDGWIPISERTLPYEMTLSVLLMADEPGVPKPIKLQAQHREFVPLDRPLDEEVGVTLARWAAGEAEPVPEIDPEAAALADELLDLADRLGSRDKTLSAIARNRRTNRGNPAKQIDWLGKQIERAQAKLADASDDAIEF